MIGGRRHDTLVNRGASRVREREIDMTTRQMFFVIALVTGAIVLVGFTLFQWLSLFRTGSVADVRAGVQAGVKPVRDRGMLVSQVVIPRPSPERFEEYIGSGADAMRTMLLIDQFQQCRGFSPRNPCYFCGSGGAP